MRSLLARAAVLLACAGVHADITEIIIGHDAAGRIQVRLIGTLPVTLDPSVFPGYPGWAEGEPGFESTTLDEPSDDFYIPDPAADFRWTLLSLDPGIQLLNDTGSGPMHPGESFYLGNAFFDVHPFWYMTTGQPGTTASVRLVIRDLSGLYTDSAILELPFTPEGCYPNCDQSTTAPILNVNDFACFLNRFAAGSTYANCDLSTAPPVLNVNDFSCFLNKFAAGCQ